MLGWLTGSSCPTNVQSNGIGLFVHNDSSRNTYRPTDDGASYIDEPPETPAPLFAVRAFKTAIFGTPHPYQKETTVPVKPAAEEKRSKPTLLPAKLNNQHESEKSNDSVSNRVADNKVAVDTRPDPLISPTKGILLTPGTAAIRRKTVTFGHVQEKAQIEAEESLDDDAKRHSTSAVAPNQKEPGAPYDEKPRQSVLTKTLIELSKQKSTRQTTATATDSKAKRARNSSSLGFHTDSVIDLNADTTVDLSQPRSRSGQHWKTEYDRYHKRSNREMKKIIKHGQNVRSYAVKKDAEATNLGEKLRKEMAKVAVMEARVAKTATQLSSEQIGGADGQSDVERLVTGLSQQTALGISYKEKAEVYTKALEQWNTQDVSKKSKYGVLAGTKPEGPDIMVPNIEAEAQARETTKLRTELGNLRATAEAAETQVVKLEKENAALKRSLARVKDEMMSYESRRQAREDRLKKREAKHKAAKEECERQLAQLTIEHQELLHAPHAFPDVNMQAESESIQQEAGLPAVHEMPNIPETHLSFEANKENQPSLQNHNQIPTSYISPRKRRMSKPAVDIWTSISPRDNTDIPQNAKETTQLPPSSVKHDIHCTLKEIDQNLITNQPSTQAPRTDPKTSPSPSLPHPTQPQLAHPPSTVETLHRKATISSPRPSMISLASSPAKLEPAGYNDRGHPSKTLMGTTGRSASLMSRADSRTSTMGSGRALPADRVAAARQRLAKRSVEKKERQGVRG